MIYGMLLESCRDGVCEVYGVAVWKRIVQELNFEHESFTTLGRYDESLIEKIAECKTKHRCTDNHGWESSFQVWPTSCRRADQICTCNSSANASSNSSPTMATTRFCAWPADTFRDFLHSIDQLHDSTRFSFPKMKSPLFHVTEEDDNGAILHYK